MEPAGLDEARDAFFEARRTESLPLAYNDIVTVTEGSRRGDRAWVISLESLPPQATYLIEFEHGSDEIVPLGTLRRDESET
jgi:hypothetical protein